MPDLSTARVERLRRDAAPSQRNDRQAARQEPLACGAYRAYLAGTAFKLLWTEGATRMRKHPFALEPTTAYYLADASGAVTLAAVPGLAHGPACVGAHPR
jgi:hypothetical protein